MLLHLALALALQAEVSGAGDLSPPPPLLGACELDNAVRADKMSQLPEDIRAELLRFFKNDLEEAGGPFNSIDVVS